MSSWIVCILLVSLLLVTIQSHNIPLSAQDSMRVWIESHQNNQKVPATGFTMEGGSSDTNDSYCEVLVRLNEIEPYNQTVAVGPSGVNDFSRWQFNFPLLSEGINSITAKYVCWDDPLLDSYYTLYLDATASDLSYGENIVSTEDSSLEDSLQYYSEDEPAGMVTTSQHAQAANAGCDKVPNPIYCQNTADPEDDDDPGGKAVPSQQLADEPDDDDPGSRAVPSQQLADEPEGDDEEPEGDDEEPEGDDE